MPIVAVIVNYRSADDSVAAIRSLQRSTVPVASIIVVDNASGDGSAQRIASSTDGVRFIESRENLGFAAGCNIGIREALTQNASSVLLLNPDATVEPTTLCALQECLERDSRTGIVGPVIVSKDLPNRIESSGIRYSLTTGRMWNIGFNQDLASIGSVEERIVDAISGCAMLIRRELFEHIGLFDENFFFGLEDIDFCLRAVDAGFRTAVVRSALVRHKGHASIGRHSPRRLYFATHNHLLLAHRRSTRAPIARWVRLPVVLGLNIAYALRNEDIRKVDALRECLAGAWAYLRLPRQKIDG